MKPIPFCARLDRLRHAFKARLELYLVGSQELQAMAPLKGTSAPHVSTATYFRFLLPRILPESVKKVLYLDADTIVPSDIGEAFKVDMAGAAVAGVSDFSAQALAAKQNVKQYINSGVILLDVEQWRREDDCRRCLAFASQNTKRLISSATSARSTWSFRTACTFCMPVELLCHTRAKGASREPWHPAFHHGRQALACLV